MKSNVFILSVCIIIAISNSSCANMENLQKPNPIDTNEGAFYKTKDNTNIFVRIFGYVLFHYRKYVNLFSSGNTVCVTLTGL